MSREDILKNCPINGIQFVPKSEPKKGTSTYIDFDSNTYLTFTKTEKDTLPLTTFQVSIELPCVDTFGPISYNLEKQGNFK